MRAICHRRRVGDRRGGRVAAARARATTWSRSTAPAGDIVVDVTDAAASTPRSREAASRLGGLDIVVNNAGIGAQGTVEDNDRRRVAPRLRRQRGRDGARRAGGAAVPARGGRRRDRQHLLGRGDRGHPEPRALQRDQGRGDVADAGDGRRPRRRGHPRERVAPGTADTPWIGRLLDAADDPEAERAALEARQPMGRLVSAEEVAEAIVYLATSTARRRARSSTSTAGCRACDCGARGCRLSRSSLRTLRRREEAGVGELLERGAALAALGLGLSELGAQLGGVPAGGVERGAQLDRVGAGGVDRAAVASSSVRSEVSSACAASSASRSAPISPSACSACSVTSTGLRRVPSRGARAARSSSVETCGSVR